MKYDAFHINKIMYVNPFNIRNNLIQLNMVFHVIIFLRSLGDFEYFRPGFGFWHISVPC